MDNLIGTGHWQGFRRLGRGMLLGGLAALLAGCEGPQSALAPAGFEAERVARLFWIMAIAAAAIWVAVIGLAVYATRIRTHPHSVKRARWLILGAGAMFPTVALGLLLLYGFYLMPRLRVFDDVRLRVAVSGEQWWWRVRYQPEGGEPIELANEIRLPVGERVAFVLSSPDVIHSFWIPSLGGKMDMIPGRTNTLILEPTRTGTFRGVCAEYCGDSHAWMSLRVVVMERPAFDAWLARQASPARAPTGEAAERGRRAFLANGCGACHRVRGTAADGTLGPDLTHVGSRLTLGAGILPTGPDDFARWIGHTQRLKPGVYMPSFGMLPDSELAALAIYLSELE